MKRMNLVGLCLVAALALCALVAATAQAGGPEFGRCVAQKKGNYTESKCLTVAEKKGIPDHKGKYEWKAGPAPTCVGVKKGFYSNSECTTRDEKKGAPKGKFEKVCPSNCAAFTTASGPVTFYTFEPLNEEEPTTLPQGATLPGVGGTVKCAASTGTGEIFEPQKESVSFTFTGCESNGQSCASPSQIAGTIVSSQITGEIVLLPAGKGVGVMATPESPFVVDCGTVENTIDGGTGLGVLTGDIESPSTSSTQTWTVTNPSEGVQAERYFLSNGRGLERGGPTLHLESHIEDYEGSPFGKFLGVGLETEQKITSEGPLNIRL